MEGEHYASNKHAPASEERGGTETETLLWTNPSPDASLSNTTILNSATITSYEKIRIYFKLDTSASNVLDSMFYEDIDMAQWAQMKNGGLNLRGCIGVTNSSNNPCMRVIRQTDDGGMFIGNCRQYNSTTERATFCIPYAVYGLR